MPVSGFSLRRAAAARASRARRGWSAPAQLYRGRGGRAWRSRRGKSGSAARPLAAAAAPPQTRRRLCRDTVAPLARRRGGCAEGLLARLRARGCQLARYSADVQFLRSWWTPSGTRRSKLSASPLSLPPAGGVGQPLASARARESLRCPAHAGGVAWRSAEAGRSPVAVQELALQKSLAFEGPPPPPPHPAFSFFLSHPHLPPPPHTRSIACRIAVALPGAAGVATRRGRVCGLSPSAPPACLPLNAQRLR